jgi:hypothetical protein
VVEGVRDEDGTFHVTGLFARVRAPPPDVELPAGEPVLLVGAEAERAIAYVESWLAQQEALNYAGDTTIEPQSKRAGGGRFGNLQRVALYASAALFRERALPP